MRVAANGAPISLYVEFLMVTDITIYNKMSAILNSTDQNKVFLLMKMYFAHMLNGV